MSTYRTFHAVVLLALLALAVCQHRAAAAEEPETARPAIELRIMMDREQKKLARLQLRNNLDRDIAVGRLGSPINYLRFLPEGGQTMLFDDMDQKMVTVAAGDVHVWTFPVRDMTRRRYNYTVPMVQIDWWVRVEDQLYTSPPLFLYIERDLVSQ